MIVFGAIITPDGSGITMWCITIPMLVLYLIGIAIITLKEKRNK
jgi:sec-independent protein translocase protein TatC